MLSCRPPPKAKAFDVEKNVGWHRIKSKKRQKNMKKYAEVNLLRENLGFLLEKLDFSKENVAGFDEKMIKMLLDEKWCR